MWIIVAILGAFLIWIGEGTGLPQWIHNVSLALGLILFIGSFALVAYFIAREPTHPRV